MDSTNHYMQQPALPRDEPEQSPYAEAVATTSPATAGIDHVGLSVADLEETLKFFQGLLGWRLTGIRQEYPAAFITDGYVVLTPWQVAARPPVQFDRRSNVGLHHLALRVRDEDKLKQLHRQALNWPGASVEFAPQLSGKGPKMHFMMSEPGGLRIEFCHDPRLASTRHAAV